MKFKNLALNSKFHTFNADRVFTKTKMTLERTEQGPRGWGIDELGDPWSFNPDLEVTVLEHGTNDYEI